MSDITFYGNKIEQDGNETTVFGAEPSDFVSEFIASEILDAMDFNDIVKYVTDRQYD